MKASKQASENKNYKQNNSFTFIFIISRMKINAIVQLINGVSINKIRYQILSDLRNRYSTQTKNAGLHKKAMRMKKGFRRTTDSHTAKTKGIFRLNLYIQRIRDKYLPTNGVTFLSIQDHVY